MLPCFASFWLLTTPLATPAAAAPVPQRIAVPVVAIDAGHGGAQEGATGICGLVEKDVTLTLARAVANILTASGLVNPLLTRHGDDTLGLEERSVRANQAGATLFLSIHANSSPNTGAHGIETFFLTNHAATGRLRHLADRENDGIDPLRDIAPVNPLDLVLRGLSLDAAHIESQKFAMRLQETLAARLQTRGRGVLQAPFMVLLKSQMAAALVEVGFLTNEAECALLASPAYQDRISMSLATAILAHLATNDAASLSQARVDPLQEL